MVHEPEGACRGNWRARPVGPENLTLRLTRIKPARPPSKRHSAGARALTSCHRLFISPPRVAARIRRTPPGGPPGGSASPAPQGARTPRLRRPALHGANVPHAFRAVAPPPPTARKRALQFAFAFRNSSTTPRTLLVTAFSLPVAVAKYASPASGGRLVASIRAPVGWRIAVKTFSLV